MIGITDQGSPATDPAEDPPTTVFASDSFIWACYFAGGEISLVARKALTHFSPVLTLPSSFERFAVIFRADRFRTGWDWLNRDRESGIFQTTAFDADDINSIADSWLRLVLHPGASHYANPAPPLGLIVALDSTNWLNLTAARIIDAKRYLTFDLVEKTIAEWFGMVTDFHNHSAEENS